MPRIEAVEFQDYPACPAVLRDGTTAFLSFVERVSGNWKSLLAPLREVLEVTGHTSVVDLCSGAGGPAVHLVPALRREGFDISLTLTDRYPNEPAFEHIGRRSQGGVRCELASIDATSVPARLTGVRTLCNSFHHFPPTVACSVLADAVAKRQPICVFEVAAQEAPSLALLTLIPFASVLTAPLWRPFRWSHLVLNWLVPILPFFILWEGVASWLRIYSPAELRAMADEIEAPGWYWRAGYTRAAGQPYRGVYLVGYPQASSTDPTQAPTTLS